MALIGEMKYLTIGGSTYQIPVPESGSSVEFTPNLTSGTKVGDLTIDDSTVSLYAPTNTDTKLQIAAVTSGTTYYPMVAANSTTAATRQYDATGLAYAGTNGTTSAVGTAKITLGNSTASGTANNKKGQITLYGSTAYATTIDPGSPTATRTITLPNATGTVALTSDIPTVPTNVSAFTNDAGYITSYTDVKVRQVNTTTSATLPILLGYLVGNITVTEQVLKSYPNLSYNPSSKALQTGGTINGYSLAAACAKAVDSSISSGSSSTNLPTTAAVASYVNSAIPTNISDFTNDVGYITSAVQIVRW